MAGRYADLLAALAALPAGRRLIAVAGAPGSGKSTLAARLAEDLGACRPDPVAMVPMDGFHYDDAVLGALGRQGRKGAPDTFDVAGLDHLLARLVANAEPKIAVPLFDRERELSRAAARLIPQGAGLVIVEGNYLLLDCVPWDRLARHFAVSVFLQVGEAELASRLARRWHELPATEAERRVAENDLPNGRLVVRFSRPADWVLAAE